MVNDSVRDVLVLFVRHALRFLIGKEADELAIKLPWQATNGPDVTVRLTSVAAGFCWLAGALDVCSASLASVARPWLAASTSVPTSEIS
jgi:hypothetical protein